MHLLSPEKSPVGPAVIKVTADSRSAPAPSAPSMRSMPADDLSSIGKRQMSSYAACMHRKNLH